MTMIQPHVLLILPISLYALDIQFGKGSQRECGVKDELKDYEMRPIGRQAVVTNVTLEIHLFYDWSFLQYHGLGDEEQLSRVVKTAMRQVQLIYQTYPGLRTSVRLVVNRFTYVEPNAVNGTQFARDYLNSLCEWQKRQHFDRYRDYDLALFLTAKFMRSNRDMAKIAGGWAFGNGCCRGAASGPATNCAVVTVRNFGEDCSTIAHEIGHTLGCRHDTDTCEPTGIMHPNGDTRIRWSHCSAQYMERLVNSDDGACLRATNGQPLWDFSAMEWQPSLEFTNNEQCAMHWGARFAYYEWKGLDNYRQHFVSQEYSPCEYLVYRHDLHIRDSGSPLESAHCRQNWTGRVGRCLVGKCVV